jgi:hypothetical protein
MVGLPLKITGNVTRAAEARSEARVKAAPC